jgi:tRNA-specific 2-thiouridylase
MESVNQKFTKSVLLQEKIPVAVAMSGGVDSSVTAALLLEQGYAVIGVTMQLFQHDQHITDAKIAADKLRIPHYVYDLRQEFQDRIIRYFCDEYNAGRTPNPCVFCNPQLKFGLLFDKAKELGVQYMATGHYVQVIYAELTGRYLLKASANIAKDQSYFLYRLTQEQLARTLFPLADMTTKDATREKAQALGLTYFTEKSESQGICFLTNQTYQQFLDSILTPDMRKPGPIMDTKGNVLGYHEGIQFYTVGQRKGFRIALGTPRYVVAIRPEQNAIVIGEEPDLLSQELLVRNLNYISIARLTEPMEVEVKVRYRNRATPARIMPGQDDDEVKVVFNEPKRAITPGQSAVFYQGDVVVGGGIIQ